MFKLCSALMVILDFHSKMSCKKFQHNLSWQPYRISKKQQKSYKMLWTTKVALLPSLVVFGLWEKDWNAKKKNMDSDRCKVMKIPHMDFWSWWAKKKKSQILLTTSSFSIFNRTWGSRDSLRDWDIFLDFGRRLWWVKTDDASLCDNEPWGRTPGTGDISSGGNMDDNDEVLSLGLELIDPKKWRKTNTNSVLMMNTGPLVQDQ